MNIDDLTIKQAKQIMQFAGGAVTKKDTCSLKIGKSYLIRTVTMMYTGRLIDITHSDFLLEDAAWIADSGRYSEALKSGSLSEVEPYPDQVAVSRAAIVDSAEWIHDLPRDQK